MLARRRRITGRDERFDGGLACGQNRTGNVPYVDCIAKRKGLGVLAAFGLVLEYIIICHEAGLHRFSSDSYTSRLPVGPLNQRFTGIGRVPE